jgi:ribosome-associated protein
LVQITERIAIDEREIKEEFVRASGPGGQNVNKVSTAVKLRFNVVKSPTLPDAIKERLIRLAGKRMTEKGVLVIDARRFRTQERNRQDALERLVKLIEAASKIPKPRKKTRPTATSKQRRLDEKHLRGEIKRMRKPVSG